ncbi:MAG: HU family DNA-binding protein [Pseudomonadales bacterium]|jgi:nucleoid DNA-binding protein|nr:HU family DNA-binding protein [Pseudomonadales bacterium]
MAADKKKAAKAAPKKAAAKAAPKKAAAKAAPKAAAKPTPVKERWSKTQILNEISERVQISRKHVGSVMTELEGIIARHIGKSGPGEFVLPGLFKINTVKKPAQKARKGIDPFTKQERMFAAKPASVKVKVRPLKKLKDLAG